jgi:hypothetical protein
MKNMNRILYSSLTLLAGITAVSSGHAATRETRTARLNSYAASGRKYNDCQVGPGVIEALTAVKDETMACLDSTVDGENVRALIYIEGGTVDATGRRTPYGDFIIVDAKATAGADTISSVVAQTKISDQSIFPFDCGRYLKGGRLIPGTNKIVALYAEAIRSVDYTNPGAPVVTMLNDRSIPGMGSTCEGYNPNWRANREDFSLDFAAGTGTLQITAEKAVEQPTDEKLTPPEMAYYHRAYSIECGPGSSDPKSAECADLKKAAEQGTFTLRLMVRPKTNIVVKY